MFHVKTVNEYYEKGKSISAFPDIDRIDILDDVLTDLRSNPENWYLFVLLFSEVEDNISDKDKIRFYKNASLPIRFYLSKNYPELAVDFFLENGRPLGMIKSYIEAGIIEFGSDDEQRVLLERQRKIHPFPLQTPLILDNMKEGTLIRQDQMKDYIINYDFTRKMTDKHLEILEGDIPSWIERTFAANDGVAAEEFLEKSSKTNDFYNNLIESMEKHKKDHNIISWMIFNLPYRFMRNLSRKIEIPILKKGAQDRFYAFIKRNENVTKRKQDYQQLVNLEREGIVRPLKEDEQAIRKFFPEREKEEIISALTLEPITGGDYVKCKNPHPHFFEADEFARWCQTKGTDCLICPVDRTYPMDPRLFHSKK